MTLKKADRIIGEINNQREKNHDTLYCTPDVKNLLRQKIGSGIGSSHIVSSLQIEGLNVKQIPKPSSGHSIAIVCKHGEVFPLTEDQK